MKYDFTTILDRHGKDALAVDAIGTSGGFGFAPGGPKPGFDAIPMWVADMNFATAPSVTEEILRRAQHPTFGYFEPSEEYYNAIFRWHKERKGVSDLTKEFIGYENGVVGGVISAVNVLCSRGSNVLLHSPCYVSFMSALKENGYNMIFSPLVKDENSIWRMDLADMEEKIRKFHIHTAIFCSPHNPTGRVWERNEIEQMMELFKKYDVYVISDEIWSDILLNGSLHVPTQSVSEDARMRTVALYSPSKTFNLAGLVGSYHIIYNPWLRDRVEKEASMSKYNAMNTLSMHALIGAYSDTGMEWTDELCQVLSGNINFACNFIDSKFSGVSISRPQGTYMLFLDCTQWCNSHGRTIDELLQAGWDVGVAWQDGRLFNGPCHIRMNLALPGTLVEEAFRRLDQFVFSE